MSQQARERRLRNQATSQVGGPYWTPQSKEPPPWPQVPPPPPPRPPSPAAQLAGAAWTRYRAFSRNMQIGVGCGFLVVALFVCSGLGAAFGHTQDATATPTATSGSSIVAQVQQTSAPQATATATATPQPTATDTAVPVPPTATPCADPCNPWGYNFVPGNYITNPPPDFCSYFNCIASFWNGTGYVIECVDTTFSLSGGHSGSCSHHGGDWRPLYSH